MKIASMLFLAATTISGFVNGIRPLHTRLRKAISSNRSTSASTTRILDDFFVEKDASLCVRLRGLWAYSAFEHLFRLLTGHFDHVDDQAGAFVKLHKAFTGYLRVF